MKEAEKLLRQAIKELRKSQMEIGPLVKTLMRLEENIKTETRGTQAKHVKMLIGEILALGVLGGVIGITFSPLIPAGLVLLHGTYILSANDWQQQNKIQVRKEEYGTISVELKKLSEGLDAKRKQVRDVYGKLTTTGTTAGTEMNIPMDTHYQFIRKLAEDLIIACNTFLGNDAELLHVK